MFVFRMLIKKCREGQKEKLCVFVDLEKAYERMLREELWFFIKESGVAEKYVRQVEH